MNVKETFKNIFNRGSETPTPLESAELSAIEPDLDEITKNLERDRQTREGLGKFLKHPFRVLTEKPVNIFIVTIPLALIIFIGGFVSMVMSMGSRFSLSQQLLMIFLCLQSWLPSFR